MEKFSSEEKELLRSCELLRELSEQNFNTFLSLSHRATYAAGDVLLKEGQDSDHLFVLISGEVELYKSNQHLIGYLAQGQSIGEMRVIKNRPCSLTVTVKAPTVVLGIFISRLRGLQYYQCYESLLDAIINVLSERLIKTNKLVERTANKNKHQQLFPKLFIATLALFIIELGIGLYYFV